MQTLCGRKLFTETDPRSTRDIANTCYVGKEPLETILATTEKTVFDLLQSRNSGDFVPIRQVAMNVLEKIEEASKPGNGNRSPDRLYRSGLQDIGFTALRLCSDRRPSFHGKDGVRIESGRSYCSKKDRRRAWYSVWRCRRSS